MTINVPDEVIEAVHEITASRITDLVPLPDLFTWGHAVPKRQKLSSKRVKGTRFRLAQRLGPNCAYCGHKFSDLTQATIDHVIPHRLVGHWQSWNLVLACEPCNEAKGTMIPERLVPVLCAALLSGSDRVLKAVA
ncbi:HNH endonuclease [Streptomyces griseosporeus]|uniref:HNH endonuclease n=1 Tax=Streptomyces griseosporeus TaxID=1910 RepID=UPI0036FFA1D7